MSQKNHLYAGSSSGPTTFVSWLPRNAVGFKGVRPILGLLRTINQVNETWYAGCGRNGWPA